MKILDVCCGSKMFWYQKEHPDVTFCDNRELETTLCDGRKLVVKPDIVADFRNLPFGDETFNLVVFDPPHLTMAGDSSWLAQKYGKLPTDWKQYLKDGYKECQRVLANNGVLIMKWNEEQISTREMLKAIGRKPLFGDKRSKTRWMVFVKEESR